MILYIKEVNRVRTYFGEDNITYYLLDEGGKVLSSCVCSSPEWAKNDLVRDHSEWKDAKIEFI